MDVEENEFENEFENEVDEDAEGTGEEEAVEEEDVKHEPDEEKEEEPPSRYRVGPSQVCSIFKSFSTFSFGSRRNADTRSWMRNIF